MILNDRIRFGFQPYYFNRTNRKERPLSWTSISSKNKSATCATRHGKAACEAVKQLSMDVGIPADLKAIVKDEDVQFLSESAYADACRPGNPRDTSVEEIAALYRSLL